MGKTSHREKAKGLILAMKAKPAEDAAAAAELHGTKPPEVQCMASFIKAVQDGDAEEALACFQSLFKHLDSQDAGEPPEGA